MLTKSGFDAYRSIVVSSKDFRYSIKLMPYMNGDDEMEDRWAL